MLETLQIGDAVEHRGIVLAPLFPRRAPVAEYATLDDALPLGLRIDEVSDAGSVPELAVTNPTDANVLLYDGEELLGAKQNRILNVTVLVAARSRTPIPVSCVEEGRWSRRSASFASAPHAAHPELRPAPQERLAGFVESIGASTRTRQPSAGLGEDVRLRGERVVGSGLELDGELLQLCAFTGDERSGRIARPSRRR